MITDKQTVIEDLEALIEMIENDEVHIVGYGVDKQIKLKDPIDFDSKSEWKDTGKRTLTLKYTE